MEKKKKKKSERDEIDEALSVPTLQIGDEIPDFTSDSTVGMFNLHEVIDGSFTVSLDYEI
jgi:predicted secreted acid phosphatase